MYKINRIFINNSNKLKFNTIKYTKNINQINYIQKYYIYTIKNKTDIKVIYSISTGILSGILSSLTGKIK